MMTVKVLETKKLNNKGASLIELIVVIAIIAVLLSAGFVAFSVLNTSNIKNATRTTKTYIEKTRTNTMSVMADEWYFEVTKPDGSYQLQVCKVLTEGDDPTVEESKTLTEKATLSLIVGDTTTELDADDVLKIKFNSASGGVSSVELNGVKQTPGDNMITLYYTVGSKENWVDLYFVSGNVEIR